MSAHSDKLHAINKGYDLHKTYHISFEKYSFFIEIGEKVGSLVMFHFLSQTYRMIMVHCIPLNMDGFTTGGSYEYC